MSVFRLIVAGSRRVPFGWNKHIYAELDYALSRKITSDQVVIVSGCAKGVDTLAISYAKDRNLECIQIPADWNRFGKSAARIQGGSAC